MKFRMKSSIKCTLRMVLLIAVTFPCTGIEALRQEYRADLQPSSGCTISGDDSCRAVHNIPQIIHRWKSKVSKSDDIYRDYRERFPVQIYPTLKKDPVVQKLLAVKFLKTLLSSYLEQPTNIKSTAPNCASQEALRFKWYPPRRDMTVGELVDKGTSGMKHLIDRSDDLVQTGTIFRRNSGFTSRRLLQTENESPSFLQASSLLEATKKRIERIKKWKKIGKIIFPNDHEDTENNAATMIRKRRAKKKQSDEEDIELLQIDDRAVEAHSEFSMATTTRSIPSHSNEIVWSSKTHANAAHDESGDTNLDDEEFQKFDRITEQEIKKEIVPEQERLEAEQEVFLLNGFLTKDKSPEDDHKGIHKENITTEKPHTRRRKKKVVITLPGEEISEKVLSTINASPRFKRVKKYRKKNRPLIKKRVKKRLRLYSTGQERDSNSVGRSHAPIIPGHPNPTKFNMTLDLPKITAKLKDTTLFLQDPQVVPSSTPSEASKQTLEETKNEILSNLPSITNTLPVGDEEIQNEKSTKSKDTSKKHGKVEKGNMAKNLFHLEGTPAIFVEANQDKKKNNLSTNKRPINDISTSLQMKPRAIEMKGATPIGYSTIDGMSSLLENGGVKTGKKAEIDKQIHDEKSPKSKDTSKKHIKVEKEAKANSNPMEESPATLDLLKNENHINDISTSQQRKRGAMKPKGSGLPENKNLQADKKTEDFSQVEILLDPSVIQDENSPKNVSRKRKKVEREDKTESCHMEENPAVLKEFHQDNKTNDLSENKRQIHDLPRQTGQRVTRPQRTIGLDNGLSELPENKNVEVDKKNEDLSQVGLSDFPSIIQDEKSPTSKNPSKKRKKVEKEDKVNSHRAGEGPIILEELSQDNNITGLPENELQINDIATPRQIKRRGKKRKGTLLVEYSADIGLSGYPENKNVEAGQTVENISKVEIPSDSPSTIQDEKTLKSKDTSKKCKKLVKEDKANPHTAGVSPRILEESTIESKSAALVKSTANNGVKSTANNGLPDFPENKNVEAGQTVENFSQVEILSQCATNTIPACDKEIRDGGSPISADTLKKRKKVERGNKANLHTVGVSPRIFEESATQPQPAVIVKPTGNNDLPDFPENENVKPGKTIEDFSRVEIHSYSPEIINAICDKEIQNEKSPKSKKRKPLEKGDEATSQRPTILGESVTTDQKGATLVEYSADDNGLSSDPENKNVEAGKMVQDISQVESLPISPSKTNAISDKEIQDDKSPKGKDIFKKRKRADKEDKANSYDVRVTPAILEELATEPKAAALFKSAANDGLHSFPENKNVEAGQMVEGFILSDSPGTTNAICDEEIQLGKGPRSKDNLKKHVKKLDKGDEAKSHHVEESPTVLEKLITDQKEATLVEYSADDNGLSSGPENRNVKTGKMVENFSQIESLSNSPTTTNTISDKEIQDNKSPKDKDIFRKCKKADKEDKANSNNVGVSPTILEQLVTEPKALVESAANNGLSVFPENKIIEAGKGVEDFSPVEILSDSPDGATNKLCDKEIRNDKSLKGKDILKKHKKADKEDKTNSHHIGVSPAILEESAIDQIKGATLVEHAINNDFPDLPENGNIKADQKVQDSSQVPSVTNSLSATNALCDTEFQNEKSPKSKDSITKHKKLKKEDPVIYVEQSPAIPKESCQDDNINNLSKDDRQISDIATPSQIEPAEDTKLKGATLLKYAANIGLSGSPVEADRKAENFSQVEILSDAPTTTNTSYGTEIQDDKSPKSQDILKRHKKMEKGDIKNSRIGRVSPVILKNPVTEPNAAALVEYSGNSGPSEFLEEKNVEAGKLVEDFLYLPGATNIICDKEIQDEKSSKSEDALTKHKKLKKEDGASFHNVKGISAAKIEHQANDILTPRKINPKVEELKGTTLVQDSTDGSLSVFPKNERVEAGKKFEDFSQVEILSEDPSIIQDKKSPKSKDISKKHKTAEKEDRFNSYHAGVSPKILEEPCQGNKITNEDQINDISTPQQIKVATLVEYAGSQENKNVEAKEVENFAQVDILPDLSSITNTLCNEEIQDEKTPSKSISKKHKSVKKEDKANVEESPAIYQDAGQDNDRDSLSKNDYQMNELTTPQQNKRAAKEPKEAPLIEYTVNNGLSGFLEDKKVEVGKKVENFLQNGLQNDILPVNLLKTSFMKLSKQQNAT